MTIATQLEILTYRELWKAQNSGKTDISKSRVPRMHPRQLQIIQNMTGEPQTPQPMQKSADDVQYKVVGELEINENDVFKNMFGTSTQKLGTGSPSNIKQELSKSAEPAEDPNKCLSSLFPF
jgi:hypothetical protein